MASLKFRWERKERELYKCPREIRKSRNSRVAWPSSFARALLSLFEIGEYSQSSKKHDWFHVPVVKCWLSVKGYYLVAMSLLINLAWWKLNGGPINHACTAHREIPYKVHVNWQSTLSWEGWEGGGVDPAFDNPFTQVRRTCSFHSTFSPVLARLSAHSSTNNCI